jgi:hypothetical protein
MADFLFDFYDTEIHTEDVYSYCYNDEPEISDLDTIYLAECEVQAEFHARKRGVISYNVRFLTITRDGLPVEESAVPSDVINRLWGRAIESYNDSKMADNAAALWAEVEAHQTASYDLQKAEA